MPAKPLTYRLAPLIAVLLIGFFGAPARSSEPLALLLFPRTLTKADDVRALVDVRKELRSHTAFEVITYDPNSAAIKRASAEANHPEWLTDAMGNDPERLALARALGVSYYVVIAKADSRGRMDIRLGETSLSAHIWSGYDQKAADAAKFLQQQTAAQPPAAVAPSVVVKPIAPVVIRPAPLPPPPAVTPKPVVSAPPPIVTVPPAAVPALVPPKTVIVLPPTTLGNTVPPTTAAPVITSAPLPLPQSPPKPSERLPEPPSPIPVPTAPAPRPETIIVPSLLPIPAPNPAVLVPAPTVPSPVVSNPDDLVSVRKTLGQGDDALAIGNFVAAIAAYREAVNGAPLSVVPRLKLAQAYLQSDLRDRALSEAQRALQIAPGDTNVQQFLMQLDAETGSSDGAVARYSALAESNPQDPSAHLELADAFWNNGALSQAEGEYKLAQTLSAKQPQAAQAASSHLARLYAAQSRYDDSLTALRGAGAGGYALALGIVQNRADTLRSTLDAAQGAFDAGKSTHEAFYKSSADVAAQAQSLADFVVKVQPPEAFKVSHLHRVLATHLLAQQATVLVSYVETADPGLAEQASRLEKEAQTEMLTAHAAEQTMGLWSVPRT